MRDLPLAGGRAGALFHSKYCTYTVYSPLWQFYLASPNNVGEFKKREVTLENREVTLENKREREN